MNDFLLSYREVVPDLTQAEKWKEFTLNTGGTQSILQDIKIPEKANGYGYKNASKYYTRNRFIYWRTNNDILELVEQSLDVNLSGNRIRLRFTDTPILDGITIHEYYGSVIILVPTVCSVHRLVFNHPDKIHKQSELLGCHPDLSLPSIFADITAANVSDPSTFYVVNNTYTSNSVLPHIAASYLNPGHEEAVFVFGYPTGELLMIRQNFNGKCIALELKQETIVPRFLSGIAGAFRGKNSDGHVAVSIILHSLGLEIYAIILCRDGNLRIWSCLKAQYIAVSDILADTTNNTNNQLVQGAQSHLLRKCITSNDTDFTLAVFLSFANECQFHIIKPVLQNGVFRIIRLSTLFASDHRDLMDFSMDDKRLWAVWRGPDGECYVNTSNLDNNIGSQWVPIILNSNLDSEYVSYDPEIDPRQSYVDFIFYPGRFSIGVIAKALSIYKRCNVTMGDLNLSLPILKQRVCMAVEQEIRTEVHEYEISDEEYIEVATRSWSKFYSCCVQYHTAGTKPLGLLLLSSVSGAVLLKKSMYSFLRPLDALEQILLCGDYTTPDNFQQINHQYLSQDKEICSDLIVLMKSLASLEEQLSDEVKFNIEKELLQLNSPDKVISELVIEIISGVESVLTPQYLWELSQILSNCNDLYRAMHLLLEILQIDKGIDINYADKTGLNLIESINYIFTSELGISVISETLRQQSDIRFSICRNLLLLQNILLERRELDWGILEAIRSVCMPDTVIFMQAYFIIKWICEQPVQATSNTEETYQRLAPLKLTPVFNLKKNQSITLLQLFTTSNGGSYTHSQFVKTCSDEDLLPHWHYSLLEYVTNLIQLLWAVSGDFLFGEWLLASGQHLLLQQYVRLLNSWCEWNNCSRNFALAVALLNNGEKYKAKDLFLKSSKGIFTETFLAKKILNDEQDEAKALVNYHLKVIQLFELYGARDCAIDVARTAISAADLKDPNIATLHSVMFVHHLALNHYEEAYNSLIANPDNDRREDNLRDLVKTLLDNKLLDVLMSFPYVDMLDTFTNIITARARACDSVRNIFYDFLYSFEVQRGNMRLAANAMYEQAYRLGQHNTLESLEQQVKCYLACLNALNLLSSYLRWVIRPVDQGEEEESFIVPSSAGNETETGENKIEKDIKPLSIQDIKNEFELASARLRLARCNKETLANQFTTPNELITMLTNMGIFKCALQLCKTFKVPYDGVFEAMTKICITLTRKDNPNAWNWLVENDLTDLNMVASNPATVCWNLLEMLLFQYEEPKMTCIHKIVCKKIILMGYFIPHWLYASYQQRNPGELLRILYQYGRIIEASYLAKQYLRAALGQGKEYFGLQHSVIPTAPALCLPLHLIDVLVHQLQLLGKKETKYKKEHDELAKIFKTYLDATQRVSNDMIRIGWNQIQ